MARVLPKVESLTFKKEELDQLDVIIGSIPAAFALGVIDMFRLANHKRSQENAKIPDIPPPGDNVPT